MATNIGDVRKQLQTQIMNKATSIASNKANALKALIEYEHQVANTELAMMSDNHGYDFKALSEDYIKAITVSTPQTEGSSVKISVTLPSYSLKDVSDKEIEFVKQFVLPNAVAKLKRMN